ncbi:MAG: hypothetical protein PHZ07_00980 [Patescibacteria group bacterium]|nr:hypothetical protein [Patescibacteria group bacterium]MDD4304643.1 hypothetical protein [Patescibacteria group bacterium]MDD4695570.1 hypothetical protein [Patescibacteria group bacterium]
MKNTTIVAICIIILVFFVSCKEHNSENSSKEKVIYSKSDSLQNAVSKKTPEKFEGLSNEMIQKIKTHTTDQKIVRVIKNSRGLESLMGHPVIGTVTVVNPNGKVLKNFPNDLHYMGDVVIEDNLKHIWVFRNSFVSHKGDRLETLDVLSNDESELDQTSNYAYDQTLDIKYNLSIPFSKPILVNNQKTKSMRFTSDSLSIKEKETFSSESLERYKIIQNAINETMSRIVILQGKLEDPIVFNNDKLNTQFKDELSLQYDLLNKQQEFIKEFETLRE